MGNRLDFIGIGSYKSASRWVVESLADHPAVETAWEHRQQQLGFFDVHYAKGYSWYHRRFRFDRSVAGEYSVSYFPSASAPARIHRYRPDVRLILSLRDPVERAYSQHKHEVRRGSYEDPALFSFERALKSNPSYVEFGRYHRLLTPWLETFDPKNLHVILVDDIRRKPGRVLERLYGFLGVDPDHRPDHLEEAVHTGFLYRSRRLDRMLRIVPDALRRLGAGPLVNVVRASGLPALVRRLNRRDPRELIPPMKEETEARLRDRFREDVESLEAVLKRDLSAWK